MCVNVADFRFTMCTDHGSCTKYNIDTNRVTIQLLLKTSPIMFRGVNIALVVLVEKVGQFLFQFWGNCGFGTTYHMEVNTEDVK